MSPACLHAFPTRRRFSASYCAMLVAARPGEPPENLLDVARSKRDHAMLQLLVANEEACDVGLEDMEED